MKNQRAQFPFFKSRSFTFLLILALSLLFYQCEKPIENNTEPIAISKYAVKLSEVGNISSTFLNESSSFSNKGARIDATQDTTSKVIEKITQKKNDKNEVQFYIVQYKKDKNRPAKNNGGYSIVSGDKRIEPVLAYSESDDYDENNLGLMSMLEDYGKLIEYAKKTFTEPKPKIKALWNIYEKAKGGKISSCPYYDPDCCPPNTYYVNGPFLNTNWRQSWPYNADSPSRACGSFGKAAAGCGPIAISQVMNYYSRPDVRNLFGITGANKPVLTPSLSYPFDNNTSGTGGDFSSLSANHQDRARLIAWTGNAASSNYYFFLNITNRTCATLTSRENIKDPFQAAGYVSIGSRNNYLSNLQTMQFNVSAGRPVIMDGTTAALAFSDWHIWVVDGIQTSEYWTKDYSGTCNLAAYLFFHHNWGQGGAGTWCGVSNMIDEGGDIYDTYLNSTINIKPY